MRSARPSAMRMWSRYGEQARRERRMWAVANAVEFVSLLGLVAGLVAWVRA